MSRPNDYVTEARQASKEFVAAYKRLIAAQDEWTALDYGNTLTAEDLYGDNIGIDPAWVGSVVFDTATAVKAEIMDTGHGTNLFRLV